MSAPEGFHVLHVLRIDWSELDYFKHVNNVSFFKYVQSARVNYWDQIGITEHHLQTGIGPMLASSACEFRRPLFYPGQVKIYTRTEFIKNTSFGFHHVLLNDAGEAAAVAHDVMVMYDFNTNHKIPFPTGLREAIAHLERTSF